MIPQIPKQLLKHSIKYTPPADDGWSTQQPKPITINNVMVQPVRMQDRTSNTDGISYQSTVFVDAKHSTPTVNFKKSATVHFDGDDMTLEEISPIYNPLTGKLHHTELVLR